MITLRSISPCVPDSKFCLQPSVTTRFLFLPLLYFPLCLGSMPENLNQTRNSYFQQNYPPSYYPNPFYHSDLENHPYSSYPGQAATTASTNHANSDPYGTMGRRYRDYNNPHHHHLHQQHLTTNPADDHAYYGSSSRYDRGQYGTDASFTANGHTSRMRPTSAVTANRLSEYHGKRQATNHPIAFGSIFWYLMTPATGKKDKEMGLA